MWCPSRINFGTSVIFDNINDMTNVISHTSMYQYADETVLLATGNDINDSKYNMQQELK